MMTEQENLADRMNIQERRVFDALVNAALNAAGGDFGFLDEVDHKSLGLSDQQFGGYVSQLVQKGLIYPPEDFDPSTNGKTKGQYDFPEEVRDWFNI